MFPVSSVNLNGIRAAGRAQRWSDHVPVTVRFCR